jgi:hypothetical protein
VKSTLLLGAALFMSASAAAARHHEKAVRIERVTSALEFSYEWPVKADQVPGLRAFLRADMQKAFAQARSDAADDARQAKANHYPFRQHSYSMAWDLEGEAARLVSLQGALAYDTNGAHPNSATKALLWDRSPDRQIFVAGLFAADRFGALTRKTYCTGLDAERLRRREGERLEGEFAQCPAYKDLSIIPVDRNHNHRFDHISFVASPYVAGPYVEGEYDISLPVTASLIAALKPEYRSSFEVYRQ